jgi:hypothetical protein
MKLVHVYSVHAMIERNLEKFKKSGPIFVPEQYISIIRQAKKMVNLI